MTHTEIIATLTAATRDAPGVRALFLSGSYGNGMADAYSDIDFIMVAEGGASDEIAALWKEAVSQTGEIVLWWDRTTVPVLINAITADWTRTDLIVLKPEQMKAHAQDTLKPLFDHDGIYGDLAGNTLPPQPSPARFLHQVEEFIRILGLLHLAAGRKEYINGVLGVFHLRNLLVELLIAETNAPHRGGVLHLNRLITDEQKTLMTSLPPAIADRDSMITTHLAYAAAFLPRARKRAAALGVDWPERFEAVTWAKLKEALGVERPYDVRA
ncbi:MAG: nucleotidyltransferase domain-containing protein [Pseudomonadota bacterium]